MAGKKPANEEKQKKERLERELDQWIADFYRNQGGVPGGKAGGKTDGKTGKQSPESTFAAENRGVKKSASAKKSVPAKKSAPAEKAVQAGKSAPAGKAAPAGKSLDRPEKTAGKAVKKLTKEPVKESAKKAGAARANPCPVASRCGGCQLLHLPYSWQLEQKQQMMEKLLKGICPVHPIVGMENPWHYRNKVHAVFDHDRKGNPISGVYEAGTHNVVPVERCLIENEKADEIIGTIRGMLKSFKIRTYDEDTGMGLLRHVLVRCGFSSGQIMVVLVTSSPVFPSKRNFLQALLKEHPEITTVVQNINDKATSMVLGEREQVLYGKGYIEDQLCGCTFRISSRSFYQVNPVQTEKLYQKAIKEAGLTGRETVLDAYCGIGTIGIIAAPKAGRVIGVELNPDAVRDAVSNARANGRRNVDFYCNDAGRFMQEMRAAGGNLDVVFMDPPRSGSTPEFIRAVCESRPKRVVYISCGPETLARDLRLFMAKGYGVLGAWPFDMFPGTEEHVETVAILSRKK